MTTAPPSPASTADTQGVWADILSQAVTGELIGMQNYASMAGLLDADVQGQIDAVEHANSELGHAKTFRRAAQELGVAVIEDVTAPYWHRIREAFLRHVHARDLTACLIVQEIMLESFAVSMYHAVADVADGKLAKTFRAIGDEEESHLEHAVTELQAARAADPAGFEAKVGQLHEEVMTILAEMVAARDTEGHCGLCHGDCVKSSLVLVGLSSSQLRGKALAYYLKALDRIGIRGEESLRWVANLPV